MVKLFLALLWLVPGVGFLVHDVWTGETLAIPFGQWRVPLAVPCLVLAAFNFLRWWAVGSRGAGGPSPLLRRAGRPRHDPAAEPDPAFRFDDPPPNSGGPT